MRVLIAAGYLGRDGETDGVVTTYRNLLSQFARSGHSVDVVAYGPEDRIEETGGVRLFVHRPRVPLCVDSLRRIDSAFAWTALGRKLAHEPYAVVQSGTPGPLGLRAHGVARRRGCPFVAIYHTAFPEYLAIRAAQAAGPLAASAIALVRSGLPALRARGRAYVAERFSWRAGFDRIFGVYGRVLHATARA